MDLTSALHWDPPSSWRRLVVIDSHTGGEPFRVVVDGLPLIPGETMSERRAYAVEHLDGLRRMLMWEPRGHVDMYGGWICPPITPGAHLAVLFCHNAGFSTMCGHGIIALTKVALDTGLIAVPEDATLLIDTPAGPVSARASFVDGMVDRVSFRNVPSFASQLEAVVSVPELGKTRFDLAFGGAFYAFVDAEEQGLKLSDPTSLITAAGSIKAVVETEHEITHPLQDDLGFLYGVIFIGPPSGPDLHSRHVCVFADGEIDRSPTGTGVSARLAILHRRGEVSENETVTFESITGSRFTGQVAATTTVGNHPAVIPEVSGTAHILGRSVYWVDPDDALGEGFLLR